MTENQSRTDRAIRIPADLEAITFDGNGLIPVVAQDSETGDVLMVAWANRKALEETLATRSMHFWSRSRNTLWKKGEASGNSQSLVSLHSDCDGDTLLAFVNPLGPACHTGERTCFGKGASPERDRVNAGARAGSSVLRDLSTIVEERDRERPEGSYTTRLLEDENLRLKKLGEEVSELIAALVRRDESASEEAADLIYHVVVALQGIGRSWAEVEQALTQRRG